MTFQFSTDQSGMCDLVIRYAEDIFMTLQAGRFWSAGWNENCRLTYAERKRSQERNKVTGNIKLYQSKHLEGRAVFFCNMLFFYIPVCEVT